jgi:ubiquinone/menaquinone biosynthesis C-methylase UbiE
MNLSSTQDNNLQLYDDYYDKPSWWFKFRYGTQIKHKTCMHLIHRSGIKIENLKVLEIGFGSGETLFSFPRNCEIYGTEISSAAIKSAENKASEKKYTYWQFRQTDDLLDFEDNAFDIVIVSHVIEHIRDDQTVINDIFRIMKTGGVAVIVIPINENYPNPYHEHIYSTLEFQKKAQAAGFSNLFSMENDLLYRLVEKFYSDQLNYRWKIIGPMIAALFNFPTAILPFWAIQPIELLMRGMGWRPMQAGFVFRK